MEPYTAVCLDLSTCIPRHREREVYVYIRRHAGTRRLLPGEEAVWEEDREDGEEVVLSRFDVSRDLLGEKKEDVSLEVTKQRTPLPCR